MKHVSATLIPKCGAIQRQGFGLDPSLHKIFLPYWSIRMLFLSNLKLRTQYISCDTLQSFSFFHKTSNRVQLLQILCYKNIINTLKVSFKPKLPSGHFKKRKRWGEFKKSAWKTYFRIFTTWSYYFIPPWTVITELKVLCCYFPVK